MQALLQQTPVRQFLPGPASWGSSLPQAPQPHPPPPPLTHLHPSSIIISVLPHAHHTPQTFLPLKQFDLKYFQHTHAERGDKYLTPYTALSDLSRRSHLLSSLRFKERSLTNSAEASHLAAPGPSLTPLLRVSRHQFGVSPLCVCSHTFNTAFFTHKQYPVLCFRFLIFM